MGAGRFFSPRNVRLIFMEVFILTRTKYRYFVDAQVFGLDSLLNLAASFGFELF